MTRNLCTVADFEKASPFTSGQLRWWIFQAEHNGLARCKAIVRVGRRVYVDPQGFERWIDAQQPASHQQAAA